MMILDTDHVSVLKYPESPSCRNLAERMRASGDPVFAITVVTAEEQMRGWLAEINRLRDVHAQVLAYDRLLSLFGFFHSWRLIPFDTRAADEFKRLRKQKVRIGTMDLKIAAIARVHHALLLSANLGDF